MMLLFILAGLALVGWLALTWWNQPENVTFKAVIQGALRDVRDVLKLDVAAHWIQTNTVGLVVGMSSLVSVLDPTMRDAIMTAHWHINGSDWPVGAIALIGLNLVAQMRATSYNRSFAAPT